jgi:antitoxin ParD1/3/4
MDVSIPEEYAAFVREQVESGSYGSEKAVLEDGLRMLKEQKEQYSSKLEALRKDIQAGIDQLDNGEGKPFDKERIKQIARESRNTV